MSRTEEPQTREQRKERRVPLVRTAPDPDQRHHHPDDKDLSEGLKVLYG